MARSKNPMLNQWSSLGRAWDFEKYPP